ncbi:MAG: hypothetical protein KFB96_06835 [Thiocapsa sp.]|nr:hypothetical protein [Thiocapsa sp.]QVL50170.1 MAG: hypothetical protein KFB96_06835 [Thiocapsa sp.]
MVSQVRETRFAEGLDGFAQHRGQEMEPGWIQGRFGEIEKGVDIQDVVALEIDPGRDIDMAETNRSEPLSQKGLDPLLKLFGDC